MKTLSPAKSKLTRSLSTLTRWRPRTRQRWLIPLMGLVLSVSGGLLVWRFAAPSQASREELAGALEPLPVLNMARSTRRLMVGFQQFEKAQLDKKRSDSDDSSDSTSAKTNAESDKAGSSAASPQQQTPQKTASQSAPKSSAPQPAPAPLPVQPGSTIDAALEMRVAVAKGRQSLSLGTSTAAVVVGADGSSYEIPAQVSYEARPTGQGIALGSWQGPSAVWIEPNQGGYVYVGDRWYRGRLLLLNQGGELLAVNYVLLQEYLYSVVGTEVSASWPMAVLQAQAVAARSYALTYHVRPAHSQYDLDNTEYFQAYKGINREANTTQEAVHATSGEFLSYQGGVVESLYAASDEIVSEAHGGRGMSQTGALRLAQQGYNYHQILGRYYPGTGLTRLVVENG